MKFSGRLLLPIIFIFVGFCFLILLSNNLFTKFNINPYVLYGANILFLVVGLLVFMIQKKALQHSNPNVFIRSIMGGMMIKMFTTVIAVFIYVVSAGADYDKKAVFLSLFMYLIYLAAEVIAISKENSKNVKKQG